MWPSLYRLFQEVRQHSTVALSGESADEVFGGYRWFHDPVAIEAQTFPWLTSVTGKYFDGKTLFDPALLRQLDMPGFLINTPEHLQALLERVDHPNCQAQLDLYHMARQGLDVAAGIALLGARIGHVQFADCLGRGAPGTGSIAFGPLLDALRSVGYTGWLAAEYRPDSPGTSTGLGWLEAWQQS